VKWPYEQLDAKFNELFEEFNPTYPKSVHVPGFKEAWNKILKESGWTEMEWMDCIEDNWSGHIP